MSSIEYTYVFRMSAILEPQKRLRAAWTIGCAEDRRNEALLATYVERRGMIGMVVFRRFTIVIDAFQNNSQREESCFSDIITGDVSCAPLSAFHRIVQCRRSLA